MNVLNVSSFGFRVTGFAPATRNEPETRNPKPETNKLS